MITRECKLETRERNHAKRLSVNDRLRKGALVNLGLVCRHYVPCANSGYTLITFLHLPIAVPRQ